MDKWISVKDKNPDSHGLYDMYYHRVRVFFEMYGIKMNEDASWIVGDRFVWHGIDITKIVTHWMPLPKPPKK